MLPTTHTHAAVPLCRELMDIHDSDSAASMIFDEREDKKRLFRFPFLFLPCGGKGNDGRSGRRGRREEAREISLKESGTRVKSASDLHE